MTSIDPKVFTDLDLFLDTKTGEHLWQPRIRDRGGKSARLEVDEVPVPDFAGLVSNLWWHYRQHLASDTIVHTTEADDPPEPMDGEHVLIPFPVSSNAPGGGAPPNAPPASVTPSSPRLDWGLVWNRIPLRVTFQPTFRALHIAISRGLWPVPRLEQLGHDPHLAARLRHAMKQPGLILFLGQMGAGKSTTMWSAILDHVATYNTKAVVLEDVNEIPAEGLYGDSGILLQIPVVGHDFGSVIPHVMRLRTQHMLINEVRDHATAREVLLASSRVSVLTTGHGHDIEQGLATIRDLAAGSEGGAWASTALANALVAVVHLRKVVTRPDGSFGIDAEALFMDGVKGNERDAIRGLIRHDQMQGLREHIQRQTASGWRIPGQSLPNISPAAVRR